MWIKKRGSSVDQTGRVDHTWIKTSKAWITKKRGSSVDQKNVDQKIEVWIKSTTILPTVDEKYFNTSLCFEIIEFQTSRC